MRNPLIALVGLVAMSPLYFSYTAAADDKICKGPDPETEKIIQHSLQRLQQTFGRRGFGFQDEPFTNAINRLKGLGFDSVDQIATITIGQRFPLYVVRLENLRSFKEGSDPWSPSLLTKTDAFIYPLCARVKNLEVRSSVTVLEEEQKQKTKVPRVMEIGNPELIRRLTEARTELQNQGRCVLEPECFAVSVPALNLHLFVYRSEGTKEFKIVTLNYVAGHVKKEDFVAAEVVLEKLSNLAKQLKDTPPNHKPKGHRFEPEQ